MVPTRRLLSTGSVLLLTLLLTFAATVPASGKVRWCKRDPIFLINGTTKVNVLVAIPDNQTKAVNGALQVILYVPVGVSAKTIYTDEGFNNHGEEVYIFEDAQLKVTATTIPILIQAAVPAERSNIPVAVFVDPEVGRTSKATGRTPRVTTVRASIPVNA